MKSKEICPLMSDGTIVKYCTNDCAFSVVNLLTGNVEACGFLTGILELRETVTKLDRISDVIEGGFIRVIDRIEGLKE